MLQKCKLHWLKEADENSKFFHRYLAARKIKVLICELKDESNGSLVNQREIEAEIIRFIESLYSSEGIQRFSLKGIKWRPISS